jgi:hypothetical protein
MTYCVADHWFTTKIQALCKATIAQQIVRTSDQNLLVVAIMIIRCVTQLSDYLAEDPKFFFVEI